MILGLFSIDCTLKAIRKNKMLMSEAGTSFKIADDYEVVLPEGDHLILVVGVPFNCSAASFEHKNVAAKVSDIFEYKHHHPKRGKFWTAKAGVNFYFLVPKTKIELLPEKGYSYVKCKMGNLPFFLNVSGGGGKGWTDVVHLVAHTGTTEKKSYLKMFAENSVLPYDFEYEVMNPIIDRVSSWQDMACRHVVELKVGMTVAVDGGNEYKIFSVTPKRQLALGRDSTGYPWRIRYRQIEWRKTAELNGIEIPYPIVTSKFKELKVAV
jgi:hypothetical protein